MTTSLWSWNQPQCLNSKSLCNASKYFLTFCRKGEQRCNYGGLSWTERTLHNWSWLYWLGLIWRVLRFDITALNELRNSDIWRLVSSQFCFVSVVTVARPKCSPQGKSFICLQMEWSAPGNIREKLIFSVFKSKWSTMLTVNRTNNARWEEINWQACCQFWGTLTPCTLWHARLFSVKSNFSHLSSLGSQVLLPSDIWMCPYSAGSTMSISFLLCI